MLREKRIIAHIESTEGQRNIKKVNNIELANINSVIGV
jgi:hypothetical protein